MAIAIGCEFSSLAAVESAMKSFESREGVAYWRRDTRSFQAAQKRMKHIVDNPDISFYEIRYTCIKGGRRYKTQSTGRRPNQRTFRESCESFIQFRASKDCKKLVVVKMNIEHNHPIKKEALHFLPKEQLTLEELAEVSVMLSTRLNGKDFRNQSHKSSGKMVTLKDITNHSKKLKLESANTEELDKLQSSGVVNLDQTKTSQNHVLSEQEKYRLAYQIGQDVAEHLLKFDAEQFCVRLECLKSICQLWKEEHSTIVTERDNVSESGSNSMEMPLKKRRKIKSLKKVPEVNFNNFDHSHHKYDQEVESSELDLGSFMAL
ncbi:uncharacterized protein [Palaemon carinicauda]|uniref:uncharacterized protein n=1 Tax=Palaemon carinicauda TaxID=392227 RepID=UPI0035B5C5A8